MSRCKNHFNFEMVLPEMNVVCRLTLKLSGQLLDDLPQAVDLCVGLIEIFQPLLDPDLQVEVAAADVHRLGGGRVPVKKCVEPF